MPQMDTHPEFHQNPSPAPTQASNFLTPHTVLPRVFSCQESQALRLGLFCPREEQ